MYFKLGAMPPQMKAPDPQRGSGIGGSYFTPTYYMHEHKFKKNAAYPTFVLKLFFYCLSIYLLLLITILKHNLKTKTGHRFFIFYFCFESKRREKGGFPTPMTLKPHQESLKIITYHNNWMKATSDFKRYSWDWTNGVFLGGHLLCRPYTKYVECMKKLNKFPERCHRLNIRCKTSSQIFK